MFSLFKSKPLSVDQEIIKLLSQLKDRSSAVRHEAARALGALALYPDNQVKIAAIPGALESLVGLLQDPTAGVREKAAAALGRLAAHADNKVKIAAIRGALESLVGLLRDPAAGVREMAAAALWSLAIHADNQVKIAAIRGALESLVGLLRYSTAGVRERAAGALGSLASNPGIAAQIERIKAGSVGSATGRSFSLTRYEDIQRGVLIGEGGFGFVFRGKWSHTDVAVKQLKVARLSDKALAEFQSEAQLHGGLHHANVVQLYAVCLEAAKYCMVMELMSNGSLFNLLHNGRELPWPLRLSIAKDIAVGLNYLHGRGILHRDLKSLNVLLDDRMRAKLSDFGLSTLKAESSSTTTAGKGKSAVGTVQWMAPELFKRGNKQNESSDIYALGMTLWELAARKIPFEDGNGNEAVMVDWIKTGEQEKIPADTPKPFADLIAQCWAQRAEVRPLTAAIITKLDASSAPASAGSAPSSGYRMFSS